MGSADVTIDHYVSWHTGDGVTLDLLGVLTPVVHHLIHNAIVLTVGTLGSGASSCLTEVDDGDHRVLGVDLNLVEAVLDDLDGHAVSLDYFVIIQHRRDGWADQWTPCQLVHLVYQSDTIHIVFLLPLLPQSHVVDANSPTFPLVL